MGPTGGAGSPTAASATCATAGARGFREPSPPPTRPTNLAPVTATGTREFKNYIGGEWVDAASGETFESASPADGEKLGTFPKSGVEDVDRAVAAAKEAFEDW